MSKKINQLFILSISALLFLASCKKDFLNLTPKNQISSDLTWGDGALSQVYVNGCYAQLYGGGFSEQMLASLSDEAVFTHTGRSINTVNEGSLNPSNLGWVDGTYDWANMYNAIRACNLGLININAEGSFSDSSLKRRLNGELHFLRAYYYHQLVRYYGGVPIITGVYDLNQDYSVARNSFEDCVNLIVGDCDTATTMLSGFNMDKGRATVLAALSLKSRILIYAASDLHDIPTAKAKSSLIASYANPELLGYVSGDRTARWQAAQAAAKAVVDMGTGYKLALTEPVSSAEGTANYIALSMGGGSKVADPAAGSELIFARYFIPDQDEGSRQIGLYNGPNGYHCWAGNTPIGLLVDDYEMMDGSSFDWSKPEMKANPYKNRDPRMYATVMYDGADWKPRDKISGDVDPANQIQTGEYDLIDDGKQAIWKGLDTRSSTIEDWNGSRTGYYMRKFIDPNPDIVDNRDRQNIPWPFFRYTEAVFNYIETSIELNQLTEATLWLNHIRFRAGMPAITETSQDGLRQQYRKERRLEMAYEEQRYHDARRWMIASETLGRKLTFINVVGKFKPGKSMTKPYHHDETIYDYTYSSVTDIAHENRQWVDKMYFRPFSRDELNKNVDPTTQKTKLIQNPGYDQ